jgi:hypothetical protein
VDQFRQPGALPPCELVPVTITSGQAHPRCDADGWKVPKLLLCGTLQVLFQQRRIAVAASLPLATTLTRELQEFKVKVTSAGNEVIESWRERDHDDTVLAVALPCWWGENTSATYYPPTPAARPTPEQRLRWRRMGGVVPVHERLQTRGGRGSGLGPTTPRR